MCPTHTHTNTRPASRLPLTRCLTGTNAQETQYSTSAAAGSTRSASTSDDGADREENRDHDEEEEEDADDLDHRTAIVVPILNVSRCNLGLRKEIAFWVNEAAKLDLELLVCKDEVNWIEVQRGMQANRQD